MGGTGVPVGLVNVVIGSKKPQELGTRQQRDMCGRDLFAALHMSLAFCSGPRLYSNAPKMMVTKSKAASLCMAVQGGWES